MFVLNSSSTRNVPGHGVHMYPNAYPPGQQQPQVQVGHSRHAQPRPLPPHNITVQLTFHSDYASFPRASDSVPYQQYTGYVNNQVNNHSQPPFTQADADARALDSGQMPTYCRDSFATPDRPGDPEPPPYSPPTNQSLISTDLPYDIPSSGESYKVFHPPVFERPPPPPQMYVSHAA